MRDIIEPYLFDSARQRRQKEIKLSNQEEVYVTEAITNKGDRAVGSEFKAAKIKELKALIERGKFKAVQKKEIAEDANIFPSCVST